MAEAGNDKPNEKPDQEQSPERPVTHTTDEKKDSTSVPEQEGQYRPAYWGQRREVPDHEQNEYGWSEYSGEPFAQDDSGERKDSEGELWQSSGPSTEPGERGYNRQDEKIQEEIIDRLNHQSQIDTANIEVEVTDGTVTLSGTVASSSEKNLVEETAEMVSGVLEMINRLTVVPD